MSPRARSAPAHAAGGGAGITGFSDIVVDEDLGRVVLPLVDAAVGGGRCLPAVPWHVETKYYTHDVRGSGGWGVGALKCGGRAH